MATTDENEKRAVKVFAVLKHFGCIPPMVDEDELVSLIWETLDETEPE